MSLVRKWMDDHGIRYETAADAGLWARQSPTGEILFAPYIDLDGERFERYREFPDGVWKQPAGKQLRLWWPLGTAASAYVLLCEGEGDTLAAASILDLDGPDLPALNGLCPVGLPGAATPPKRVAAELLLHGTRHVYICLDGDEPGRKATHKLARVLIDLGVAVTPVYLDGCDLAEYLTQDTASGRPYLLANLLGDADAVREDEKIKIQQAAIFDKLGGKK